MDWLLLVLLLPAIIVPIVLLFGFAGCTYTPPVGRSTPTIVGATPLDAFTVELLWTDSNGVPATYEVERTKGMDLPSAPMPVTLMPLPGQPLRFVDNPLPGAGKYSYRIRAIITGDGAITGWSAPAPVETWSRVFTSSLEQGGVNESVVGNCIVQRVSPSSLAHGGNLIAVTLRGDTNGDLAVSRVTISNAALVGDDFDSAANPVDITTSRVIVSPGLTLPLQPTPFNVNVNEALLIAFDVDNPGNGRVVRGVAHTAYMKAPPPGGTISEAGTQNRAGFAEQPNELWFIDAIDVATKWPPVS